jgi:2-phosphoglycerate kinase
VQRPELKSAVQEIIGERARPAAAGMPTKIIAIDGPGGAGKSSLAALLAHELGSAPVLHTDDFAS